jgi:hypothetical protein
MTRPTQQLWLVHDGSVPPGLGLPTGPSETPSGDVERINP